MRSTLSAAEARRAALAAQGFARGRTAPPGAAALSAAVRRMGTLQIDSVNVFARSHYMPLFSRLGPYDTAALDRLLFSRRAPYVEYWAHVASFIRAQDWSLFAFRMQEFRDKYVLAEDAWGRAHADTLRWVRDELAERGPSRPAELEGDLARGRRGGWWEWSAVKRALELMWLSGDVAIADRRGFERRYALAEQVIPAEVLAAPVDRSDAVRELIGRAARAYGVATAADLADYWRLRDRRTVLSAIDDLVDGGELNPVVVEGWSNGGGRPVPAWLHRDAVVPRTVDATAILTPFDPVVWFRDRAQRMFGFEYRIEIYTPAPRRRYGYYSLPVLIDDDIVARVDLKADRATSTLLVQSAWWEAHRPESAPDRLAVELQRAAAWQGLERISVSRWGDAVDHLAAALPGAARHDRSEAEPVALAPEEPA